VYDQQCFSGKREGFPVETRSTDCSFPADFGDFDLPLLAAMNPNQTNYPYNPNQYPQIPTVNSHQFHHPHGQHPQQVHEFSSYSLSTLLICGCFV
jgi:hypothetical protein